MNLSTLTSENKFVASRSALHVWNKLNRCRAFVLKITRNCFLKSMQCRYIFKSHVLRPPCFSCSCETWTERFKWYFSGTWYNGGRCRVLLLLNNYGDPSFLLWNLGCLKMKNQYTKFEWKYIVWSTSEEWPYINSLTQWHSKTTLFSDWDKMSGQCLIHSDFSRMPKNRCH